MKTMQFSINIKAPRETVWKTLWSDKTFRVWANHIDEGMYLMGDLKEGSDVHFRSPNGNGVISKVIKLVPNALIRFQHRMDTLDNQERDEEWTGGTESYSLTEIDNVTTLTMETDIPLGQEEYFQKSLPRALGRIKELAEV